MSELIDHEYTDEIVCPWCGYEHGDSWEGPESGEDICDECEKTFAYCRQVEVTYFNQQEGREMNEMNDDYDFFLCPCCDGSGWDDETDDFCPTCDGWGMV